MRETDDLIRGGTADLKKVIYKRGRLSPLALRDEKDLDGLAGYVADWCRAGAFARLLKLPFLLFIVMRWLPELVYALNRVLMHRWRHSAAGPRYPVVVQLDTFGRVGLAQYSDGAWRSLDGDKLTVIRWRFMDEAPNQPWHE